MIRFYCNGKKDFCYDERGRCDTCGYFNGNGGEEREVGVSENKPEIKFVYVPCNIGDTVWAIRNYHGTKKVVSGKVSEMYFAEDMSICIVVKNVTRGRWGEKVFGTEEEALRSL